MNAIFQFFGSILGYLLWFLYTIFKNYGVAIIFFTIILRLALFPTTIKQQRNMASQAKLSAKQRELQKKYANNRAKYNEELQKLYEKEGVNPSSGCLTSLLPLPIMLGIFYSVSRPLTNTLHISSANVANAVDYVSKLPGTTAAMGNYAELQVVRQFDALRESLQGQQIFTGDELSRIGEFTKGFKFLGLDLLATPWGSAFSTFLWIIPVLSLVFSVGFQIYTMIYQRRNGQQQQMGCMVGMMLVFPLISVYWAFIMPAAVGFYWVISSAVSWVQTILVNRFFSIGQMAATQEARHAVAMELAEASVRPLPAAAQKEMADRLAASAPQQKAGKESGKQNQKKKKG